MLLLTVTRFYFTALKIFYYFYFTFFITQYPNHLNLLNCRHLPLTRFPTLGFQLTRFLQSYYQTLNKCFSIFLLECILFCRMLRLFFSCRFH